MHFKTIKTISEKQKREIIKLWNDEYPKALSYADLSDFEQYLQGLSALSHVLLSDEDDNIKGWLIFFMRNGEQYFALIIDAALQSGGWGTRLLNIAKQNCRELNGWVIDNDNQLKQNGENYRSPISFYIKNGFEIRTDIRINNKNINGIKVIWRRQ